LELFAPCKELSTDSFSFNSITEGIPQHGMDHFGRLESAQAD
jgi:hypothetical protein